MFALNESQRPEIQSHLWSGQMSLASLDVCIFLSWNHMYSIVMVVPLI